MISQPAARNIAAPEWFAAVSTGLTTMRYCPTFSGLPSHWFQRMTPLCSSEMQGTVRVTLRMKNSPCSSSTWAGSNWMQSRAKSSNRLANCAETTGMSKSARVKSSDRPRRRFVMYRLAGRSIGRPSVNSRGSTSSPEALCGLAKYQRSSGPVALPKRWNAMRSGM